MIDNELFQDYRIYSLLADGVNPADWRASH